MGIFYILVTSILAVSCADARRWLCRCRLVDDARVKGLLSSLYRQGWKVEAAERQLGGSSRAA